MPGSFGMTVSLRPLLANGSASAGPARAGSRSNEAAWFSSYKRFLRPYLILAQHDGVAEFIEGTEFSQFDTAPGWRSLNTVGQVALPRDACMRGKLGQSARGASAAASLRPWMPTLL